MPESSEDTEVNEILEVSEDTEGMYVDFEAELDDKCEEYSSGEHIYKEIKKNWCRCVKN